MFTTTHKYSLYVYIGPANWMHMGDGWNTVEGIEEFLTFCKITAPYRVTTHNGEFVKNG